MEVNGQGAESAGLQATETDPSSSLSKLLCGPTSNGLGFSEIDQVLQHVSDSIDTILRELVWLNTVEPHRIALFGPFLGRSLQELAALALLGRLDPVRVLLIQKVQAQSGYQISMPWKSSLRWQGDVLAEKAEKPVDLWSEKVNYDSIKKALLGDYFDHLLWQPAVGRLLLQADGDPGNVWLAELRREDQRAFLSRRRNEFSHQYSSFSKGIHHEFVLPAGAQYDKSTIAHLIGQTVRTVATLGLVSHFIPHSTHLLSAAEAFRLYEAVEDLEVLS